MKELPKHENGLVYYPGKDVVKVEVKVQKTVIRKLNNDDLKPKDEEEYAYEGKALLQTVADVDNACVLTVKPGGWFKNSLKIETGNNGILKTINLDSQGMGGAIVKNIIKFGSIAAALISPAGMPFTALSAGVLLSGEIKVRARDLEKAQKTKACQEEAETTLLPPDVRKLITGDPKACSLWLRMKEINGEIREMQRKRLEKEKEIAKADADKLKHLKSQLAMLVEAVKNLEKQQAQVSAAFNVLLQRLRENLKLGTKISTSSHYQTFKICEIPDKDTILKNIDNIECNLRANNYNKMAAFFKDVRVIITLEHLSEAGKKLECRENSSTNISNENLNHSEEKGEIFYRQSLPMLLTLYACDAKGKIFTLSEEVVTVMHPEAPLYHFTFKPNAFSKRKLSLVFDANGRPVVVERSSTSSVKNLTGALADAAQTARDEYAATLKKVEEIQESRRNIKLNELTTQIEALKKEKEWVDARLALEGATENYELLLKQKQLQAELEVLNNQLALEKAKETADQQIELEKLKLQLQKLNQELEIIKTRLAIEEKQGK